MKIIDNRAEITLEDDDPDASAAVKIEFKCCGSAVSCRDKFIDLRGEKYSVSTDRTSTKHGDVFWTDSGSFSALSVSEKGGSLNRLYRLNCKRELIQSYVGQSLANENGAESEDAIKRRANKVPKQWYKTKAGKNTRDEA